MKGRIKWAIEIKRHFVSIVGEEHQPRMADAKVAVSRNN